MSQLLTLFTTPVVYLSWTACASACWAARTTRCPKRSQKLLREMKETMMFESHKSKSM